LISFAVGLVMPHWLLLLAHGCMGRCAKGIGDADAMIL
jgi:hypothetical protein